MNTGMVLGLCTCAEIVRVLNRGSSRNYTVCVLLDYGFYGTGTTSCTVGNFERMTHSDQRKSICTAHSSQDLVLGTGTVRYALRKIYTKAPSTNEQRGVLFCRTVASMAGTASRRYAVRDARHDGSLSLRYTDVSVIEASKMHVALSLVIADGVGLL